MHLLELRFHLAQLTLDESAGRLGFLFRGCVGGHLAAGLGLLHQLLQHGRILALLTGHLQLSPGRSQLLVGLLLHQFVAPKGNRQGGRQQHRQQATQQTHGPEQRRALVAAIVKPGCDIHQHQAHQGQGGLLHQPFNHQLAKGFGPPIPKRQNRQQIEEQEHHQGDPHPAKQRAEAG